MPLHRNCEGFSRRDCLQLGLGAFLGGGLVRSLAARDAAAPTRKATGCILIWLDGGPTHYETFDPKPTAPKEIRGEFSPIATKVPGVQFCEYLPKLAAIANKYSVIRSIQHNEGNHGAGNHYMMTGAPPRIPVGCGAFVSFHPSMGAVAAHELKAPAGMPAYFTMPEMSRSGGPSFLGARYAPFVVADNPNTSGFRVRDVALPPALSGERFASRQEIRGEVDRLLRYQEKAVADPALALDDHYKQAFDLMASREAQAAFDISREPESIRNRFGRTPFGQRALLARRLVEAGVPFVTLYEGGWDHHTEIFPTIKKRVPAFEASIAALIEDLDQRGLLATTMVLVLGEFGRTPKVNERGGRDHWSSAMSVLFAGGGAPGGLVVGSTDAKGYSAIERVLAPENLVSTVYAKLGIDPGKVLFTPTGRPTHLVSDPTPIKELMA